jgi:hypothetical protein
MTTWPAAGALMLAGLIGAARTPPADATPGCGPHRATTANVGRPTSALAWRASLLDDTRVYARLPGLRRARGASSVSPSDSLWLLVLSAKQDRKRRCWIRVRLPSRPNDAAGWVNATRVDLQPTRWRIVASRARRTLALQHAGRTVMRTRTVVGAPGTPTPAGLFSIVGVWRWNPSDFLGSYILPLTSHSPVLQEFGGGDGRIGIHGRGGASLQNPLGSAASHGCIRLSNDPIEALVRRVGADELPGIPVRVT